VRLIRQSTFGRNIGERLVAEDHHLLCPLDPSPDDVSIWRFTEIEPERARQLSSTKARDRGEIVDPNRACKVLLDEFHHAPGLPRCKMPVNRYTSRNALGCFAALDLGLKNVGGFPN
jgi:hypothetical protein